MEKAHVHGLQTTYQFRRNWSVRLQMREECQTLDISAPYRFVGHWQGYRCGFSWLGPWGDRFCGPWACRPNFGQKVAEDFFVPAKVWELQLVKRTAKEKQQKMSNAVSWNTPSVDNYAFWNTNEGGYITFKFCFNYVLCSWHHWIVARTEHQDSRWCDIEFSLAKIKPFIKKFFTHS